MRMWHGTDSGHTSLLRFGVTYFVTVGLDSIPGVATRQFLTFEHCGIRLCHGLVESCGLRPEYERLHNIGCIVDKYRFGILHIVYRQPEFLECLFILIDEFTTLGHIVAEGIPRTLQLVVCHNLRAGTLTYRPSYPLVDLPGTFELCLTLFLGFFCRLIAFGKGIKRTHHCHHRHCEQHVWIGICNGIECRLRYRGCFGGYDTAAHGPCAYSFGCGCGFGLDYVDTLHKRRLLLQVHLHRCQCVTGDECGLKLRLDFHKVGFTQAESLCPGGGQSETVHNKLHASGQLIEGSCI